MMMDRIKMITLKVFVILMSGMMVSSTNTVKMERMTHSKDDSSSNARIGVLEVEKSWPMSDEFKAILGNSYMRIKISKNYCAFAFAI